MYVGLHVKCPLSCQILMELEFSLQIFEKYSKKFMKICPVGAELFHAEGRMDGRTDVPILIVAFRNFANAPNNEWTYTFSVPTRLQVPQRYNFSSLLPNSTPVIK
jgi:hypothetical protein